MAKLVVGAMAIGTALDGGRHANAGQGLKVWAPLPGKTLFERLGRREIGFSRSPAWESEPPDLIVFPYPHSATPSAFEEGLGRLVAALDPPLMLAIGQGRTRLVFDASAEGEEHNPLLTKAIHRGLAWLKAPSGSAVLITQERNYEADYAAYCARKGMPELLRVACYDLWIKRFHQQFEDDGAQRLEQRLSAFRARTSRRERRFVSLNLTARKTKLLFLLSLLRDGLWEQGHISFGGLESKLSAFDERDLQDPMRAKPFEVLLRGMSGFADLGRELTPLLPELTARGPILLGQVSRDPANGRVTKTPLGPDLAEYDRSWFSVVTETEMRNRPSRITEKPFMAIVNLHPFLLLGNPGGLKLVRELGFVTFEDELDEAYDEEPDPRRRFDMVYGQVLGLCRLEEAELARMEAATAEKLAFNAEWALTRLPAIYRDRLDQEVLQQLAPQAAGAAVS
jgi:hypothetical protein